MQPYPPSIQTLPEPPAPVAGGMRWHRLWHDIARACRLAPGLRVADPERRKPEPYQPEAGMAGGPVISSTPPPEARQGREYVYQPKAYDAFADGFTWSLDNPPAGMQVERHSGRISWTPVAGGYVDIVLIARSLYGKTAVQRWTVCVRWERASVNPIRCPRYQMALRRKQSMAAVAAWPQRPRPIVFFRRKWRRPSLTDGRGAGPPEWWQAVALPLRL